MLNSHAMSRMRIYKGVNAFQQCSVENQKGINAGIHDNVPPTDHVVTLMTVQQRILFLTR